jgi:hypothetical protein
VKGQWDHQTRKEASLASRMLVAAVWQKSSRTGAAAITLGGGETNYCHLSVVLPLTNTWQGSVCPVTECS